MKTYTSVLAAAGFMYQLLSFWAFYKCNTTPAFVLNVLVCVTSLLLAAVCWLLASRLPADSHSWLSFQAAIQQSLVSPLQGWWQYVTKVKRRNFAAKQWEHLKVILESHQYTEMGKNFRIGEIHSTEAFQERMPLSIYEDYADIIKRMMKGEGALLSNETPMFFSSSECDGGIYLPMSDTYLECLRDGGYYDLEAYVVHASAGKGLGRLVHLRHTQLHNVTESSVPAGFCNSLLRGHPPNFISPDIQIQDETQMLYVHAVFACYDDQVDGIMGVTPQFMSAWWKVLHIHEKTIVNDIEIGSLNPYIGIHPQTRTKLNKMLTFHPTRANQVGVQFQRGPKGLAKRLWPHLRYVSYDVVDCGLANEDLPELEGVTILYSTHIVAGTVVGIAVPGQGAVKDPWDAKFFMTSPGCFVELLPEDSNKALATNEEVNPNEKYQLVLTTINGLYRYKSGVCVTVTAKSKSMLTYKICKTATVQ